MTLGFTSAAIAAATCAPNATHANKRASDFMTIPSFKPISRLNLSA
jgi:hypothetical protein